MALRWSEVAGGSRGFTQQGVAKHREPQVLPIKRGSERRRAGRPFSNNPTFTAESGVTASAQIEPSVLAEINSTPREDVVSEIGTAGQLPTHEDVVLLLNVDASTRTARMHSDYYNPRAAKARDDSYYMTEQDTPTFEKRLKTVVAKDQLVDVWQADYKLPKPMIVRNKPAVPARRRYLPSVQPRLAFG
jgi:hypothetical protein